MTERRLSVLFAGCGHIAGGAGLPALDGEALSHAAAYAADGRFDIAACVDPDEARRTRFTEDWNAGAAFADLDAALAGGSGFDIASVCVPSELHAQVLWRLLDTDVRTVLCEKPLTTDFSEAQRLVAAYENAGKPLAVAYTRRWHRAVRNIAEELVSGKWGRVRSVHACYTRGVRHTGSHVIDLLHMLVGPMDIRYAGNPRYDYSRDDPTVDAVLIAGGDIAVHLIGGDGSDFGLLDIQLATEQGSITFEDWTTRLRRRETTQYRYAPHMRTLETGSWEECGAGGSFEAMIDNVYRAATQGAALDCDGRSALEAQRLAEELITVALRTENAA